jgi:3alpha(or 20beta)-hydroxysteroid dehydrogenase
MVFGTVGAEPLVGVVVAPDFELELFELPEHAVTATSDATTRIAPGLYERVNFFRTPDPPVGRHHSGDTLRSVGPSWSRTARAARSVLMVACLLRSARGFDRSGADRAPAPLRSRLVSGSGRMEGRAAIVTGAARGTGAVIAGRLAAEGALVIVADVLDDRGREVVAAIGTTARYVHCDVTREDDWTRLITETTETFGRLDVLVNNAAVLLLAAIEDTTAAAYRRVFEVNELGTFLGIRAAIAPMRAAGGGSIVNISSIDGVFVTPGTAAYAASKFAVRGLTKTAALELGRFGIRVNAVCPAAGNMEMVIEALPRDFDLGAGRGVGDSGGGTRHRAPLGRRGRMEDVADAVVFFASDESAFVSGTDLMVDGAMSAGMIIPGQPGT